MCILGSFYACNTKRCNVRVCSAQITKLSCYNGFDINIINVAWIPSKKRTLCQPRMVKNKRTGTGSKADIESAGRLCNHENSCILVASRGFVDSCSKNVWNELTSGGDLLVDYACQKSRE